MSLAPGGTRDLWLRMVVALLALLSVAPLLAWVFGLGAFATWYWAVTVPALVALAGLSLWLAHGGRHPALVAAMRAGVVGGLLGTVGYDLVRVPFALAGLRLLAPIDSYGLLVTNAASSTGVTGFFGWFFHFTNGICFGIAFAAIAAKRPVWWAVGWAMVLETATIVTPFVDRYGLKGHPELILIAYAAHVAYGVPLGLMCRDPERTKRQLAEIVPYATSLAIALTVVALAVWQRPWSTPSTITRGEDVAPGPSAIIHGGDFSPAWLRMSSGQCVTLRNDDGVAHQLDKPAITLEPGVATKVCISSEGVHRVKVDGKARSGGFVLVDPEDRL